MRAVASCAACAIVLAVVSSPSRAQAPDLLSQWTVPDPHGVAVDAAGDVYVVDTANHRVLKYTAGGGFLTQWGAQGNADGEFQEPRGIAVDATGVVYVTDKNPGRVQKFTSSGAYLGQWSTEAPIGTGREPCGIAVDGEGVVYVCQELPYKYTPEGNNLGYVGTGEIISSPPGTFNMPLWVAIGPGNAVYVADVGRSIGQIQKFSSAGDYLLGWNAANPSGVAVSATGDVYVVQQFDNNVRKFDSSGVETNRWNLAGGFFGGGQVAVSPRGDVYVTSAFRHTVTRYGDALTPAARTTWGRIKAFYR